MAAQTVIDQAKPLHPDAASPEHWQFQLLQAEMLLSRGNAKQAAELLQTEPPNGPELETTVSRWRAVRGKVLRRLGRTAEAQAALDEAEQLAKAGNQLAVLAEIYIARSNLLDGFRKYAEAEASLQSALQYADSANDRYWQTTVLNNLGVMRLREFRYDEALPWLNRAKDGFEAMDAKLSVAGTLTNIAVSAGYLGDLDKASAALTKAAEVQESEGQKPALQGSLGELGNLYMYRRDFAKAVPYYERALAISQEVGNVADASKWSGNLAVAMLSMQRWDEAERYNDQSRQLKEKVDDHDSLLKTRLNAADIARGRGQTAPAENLYQGILKDAAQNLDVASAHAGLARLYRKTGATGKASSHFEAAVRAIDLDRAELTAEHRITFQSRLFNFYQEYVDALVEQNAPDRALEVAESSRARVLAERFGKSRERQAASTQTFVQAARQSGTVFLSYWLAPARSFMWVITAKGSHLFMLPAKDEIEQLVQAYQGFIDDSRDPLDAVPPSAARLYEMLLAPARDLIPRGSRVVIVADEALHNLNFETLPVPDATPHFWIEDVTMSVAPALAVSPPSARPTPPKSLLLIGDPVTQDPEYQPLPYAAMETGMVKNRLARLQQTVYSGQDAAPPAYLKSDPGKYSIIHFAAHAVANRENPLESAIVLSQSAGRFKLYARDILDATLQAQLVTISACRGAGARIYSGEGLVGFTWAFLQAGAKNVIAGLWDVTDRSTAQIMDELYQHIDAGMSPAEALRLAKLSLIHSNSNFRKPYYWGAFQVYIGGGRR